MRHVRRGLCLLLLVTTTVTTSGCSVVGAAVGATIPEYRNASAGEPAEGQRVRLRLRRRGTPCIDANAIGCETATLTGGYVGHEDGSLVMRVRDDVERVRWSDVERVEVATGGTMWKTTALLGGVLDLVFVGFMLIVVSQANYGIRGGGGLGGVVPRMQ